MKPKLSAMSNSNPVILHLSDIQFGTGCLIVSKEQMLRKLISDISRYASEGLPCPNIIVISGDMIDKGSLESYDNALWFIRNLAKFLKIPSTQYRNRIIVVPGNHDVKREIADNQPLYKFFAFERFCNELFGNKFSAFCFDRGKHYAVSLVDSEPPLVFIALNSCERISSDNAEGYISPDIVKAAITDAKKLTKNKTATYICVFHHNAVALETNDRLVNFYSELKDIFIRSGVSLCLHGHIHNHHVEEFATDNIEKSLLAIASGSLAISADQRPASMGSPAPNQYNVISLDFRRQEGTLYVRQFRPELTSIDEDDYDKGRWQEYRAFKVKGSDSAKYVFSLRSRGYIAPPSFVYAKQDIPLALSGETDWISRLLNILKPSQRMLDIIGHEIDSAVAVDDGLLFLRSDLRVGWRPEQIDMDFVMPFVLPPNLQHIAQRNKTKLSLPNRTKYMVKFIVPPVLDRIYGDASVKIHLSPISYFDIRGVELALDEPMGVGENPQSSLRQLYFKDHALFTNQNQLPNKAVLHILVVTADHKFIVMRRSQVVEFQNAQWSATFEEQMQGDYLNEITGISELGDEDFFATAVRGLREELGIVTDRRSITLLGICSEYENLAYNIIGIAKLDIHSSDVINGWKLHAPDKAENTRILPLPFEQEYLNNLLQKEKLCLPEYGVLDEIWHPTSRIRIIIGALHLLRQTI